MSSQKDFVSLNQKMVKKRKTDKDDEPIISKSKRGRSAVLDRFFDVYIVNFHSPYVVLNPEYEDDLRQIKLGTYIYPVQYHDWIPRRCIGLNVIQHEDLKKYIFRNQIMVYQVDSNDFSTAHEVELRLTLYNSVPYYLKLNYNDICDGIREYLNGQIVHVNQKIIYPCTTDDLLILMVESIDNIPCGEIGDYTTFNLTADTSDIVIYKETIKVQGGQIHAKISDYEKIDTTTTLEPLIFDKNPLNRQLFQNLRRKKFADEKQIILRYHNYNLTIDLSIDSTITNSLDRFKYKYLYELVGTEPIHLTSTCKKIILTSDEENADKITLNIVKSRPVIEHKDTKCINVPINADILIESIRQQVELVTIDYTFSLVIDQRKYTFKVEEIKPSYYSDIMKAYRITSDTKIKFKHNQLQDSSIVLVDNTDPSPIKEITFKIKKGSSSSLGGLFKIFGGGSDEDDDKQKIMINYTKLIKQIRNSFPSITTLKHKVKICHSGEYLHVKVVDIVWEENKQNTDLLNSNHQIDTTMTPEINEPTLNVTDESVVNTTNDLHEIDESDFKMTNESDLKTTNESDFKMTNESDLKTTNESDLKTTNESDLKTTNESDLKTTNESDLKSDHHAVAKEYFRLGKIVPETKINIKVSEKDKSLCLNKPVDSIHDPIVELEKYVGGMSDQLKTVVRTLVLSRGKLKDEFQKRGLKPTKGIVLYGPPGNGKTTLARNIGKIFGCEGDRFQLIAGPEVFIKWVGDSEKKVRSLFKPAKNAWKKYGKNSPLYMLVIDEIDAMLPVRGSSPGNPVADSVVNQFLSELDGLMQFDNFICIGLTNRLELIDSAVTREGRLGIHIEVGLPNKEGRLKIWQIHTKNLRESDRLGNISYEKLVDASEGFSGAQIEETVIRASNYSLERLSKLERINSEAIEKSGRVTMEDLERSIKELRNNDKDKAPIHMYI